MRADGLSIRNKDLSLSLPPFALFTYLFFLSGLNVCSHRGSQIKPKDFPQTASSALQAKVATFPHPS